MKTKIIVYGKYLLFLSLFVYTTVMFNLTFLFEGNSEMEPAVLAREFYSLRAMIGLLILFLVTASIVVTKKLYTLALKLGLALVAILLLFAYLISIFITNYYSGDFVHGIHYLLTSSVCMVLFLFYILVLHFSGSHK